MKKYIILFKLAKPQTLQFDMTISTNQKKSPEYEKLCQQLSAYMSPEDVDKAYMAYELAFKGHAGQMRKSGEQYISHPVAVAMILADLRLDIASICSALLHDCIEDTHISKAEIAQIFGEDIANIVDGVTKLTGLDSHSVAERQAENFRKLFLAMSNDVRVILIKLSDRLHNMRTIGAMSPDSRRRIAKETLELHAPIAHRLGLNKFKSELENLSFEALYPFRHKVITHHISSKLGNKESFVAKVRGSIEQRLWDDDIPAKIVGRKKDSYSIYNKMNINKLKLREVFDVYAFRLIVDNLEDCYRALGSMHNIYKPMPGKFKDYIALPKVNGYQSLHTVLFTSNEILIEVQIRSKEMDFMAEQGVAAHWRYKEHQPSGDNMSYWLDSIMDIKNNTQSPTEFLSEVKSELSPNEVFVFTPDGEIVQLPYNATIIDFAYAVHTEIGNHFHRAKIDKKPVLLSTKLTSGQTIYIQTKANVNPNPNWLDYATTSKARLAIKHALKNYSKNKLTKLGKDLLLNHLSNEGLNLDDVSKTDWQDCLHYLSCQDDTEFYQKIGMGEIFTSAVVSVLFGDDKKQVVSASGIKNTHNATVHFSNCCHPIPGDKIIGAISTGKGMMIHRDDCPNIDHVKSHQPQWINLDWAPKEEDVFVSGLRCDVQNRRGVLANLVTTISAFNTSIEDVVIQEKDNKIKSLLFMLSIKNTKQLKQISQKLTEIEYVNDVSRL